MIITLSGYPGTQTRKLGKILALELGLKFVSEENICRENGLEISDEESVKRINEIIKEEAAKGGKLVEGILAPIALENADLRVFLLSSKNTRAKSVAVAKNISSGEALSTIEEMETKTGNAILNAKGVDAFDLNKFDVAVNLDKIKEDGAIAVVKKCLGEMK